MGLANNQLKEVRHGKMLADRGITYVPDYVVNAGGDGSIYSYLL